MRTFRACLCDCFCALLRGAALIFACVALSPEVFAHKASDAYLMVSEPSGPDLPRSAQGAFQFKFSIALRDIDAQFESLDQNNDRQLSWLEVREAMPLVESWAREGFSVVCADVRNTLGWSFDSLEQRSDGAYVRLQALHTCAEKSKLAIQYELMKDIDSGHRLLVAGVLGGEAIASAIEPQTAALKLTSGRAPASLSAQSQASSDRQEYATFKRFFTEGFWHLSFGFDHLAFLLALVLPLGLARSGLLSLLGTITTFTLGHSITLGLATFGWVASPVWVEPAITLSIAFAALLNLYSGYWRGAKFGFLVNTRWLALIFGLIHGLGFSGVMTEAGIDRTLLLWALGGFNLGLEAAQLCAVAIWLSLCYAFTRMTHFKADHGPMMVRTGSSALLLMALIWTAQRLL